ncbi:hypothetical protein BJ742DRAFT_244873 [Cladochytrium replicatum]|nr:hypothetical protein BJ742DRAFT_244873 [Cladochytrium replicatum]
MGLGPSLQIGAALLRFAAMYGFRNIQSLVRKVNGSGYRGSRRMKASGAEYPFVEVMAGHLEGSEDTVPLATSKVWVANVEAQYRQPFRWHATANGSKMIETLYSEWLGGEDSEKRRFDAGGRILRHVDRSVHLRLGRDCSRIRGNIQTYKEQVEKFGRKEAKSWQKEPQLLVACRVAAMSEHDLVHAESVQSLDFSPPLSPRTVASREEAARRREQDQLLALTLQKQATEKARQHQEAMYLSRGQTHENRRRE